MKTFRVWLYKDGKKYHQLKLIAKDRHSAEHSARLYGMPIGAVEEDSRDNICEVITHD